MLSIRGQVHMEHYEGRLRLVLGATEYRLALELLTEAAVNAGHLSDVSVNQYRDLYSIVTETEDELANIEDVLRLLEHDGYIAREDAGISLPFRYVRRLVACPSRAVFRSNTETQDLTICSWCRDGSDEIQSWVPDG